VKPGVCEKNESTLKGLNVNKGFVFNQIGKCYTATAQLSRQITSPFWGQVFGHHSSTLSNHVAFLGPGFRPPRFKFVESGCLFGARFSAITVQLCRIRLPFWGQVFGHHSSTLSNQVAFLGPGFRPSQFNFVESRCLFGARFSPRFKFVESGCLFGARFSPRLNFLVKSRCLFGARFPAITVQLCRITLPFLGQVFGRHGSSLSNHIAFFGPGFRPPRFKFVESHCFFWARFPAATVQVCRITLLFLGQVFGRHGST
jgi:hypothetical protein